MSVWLEIDAKKQPEHSSAHSGWVSTSISPAFFIELFLLSAINDTLTEKKHILKCCIAGNMFAHKWISERCSNKNLGTCASKLINVGYWNSEGTVVNEVILVLMGVGKMHDSIIKFTAYPKKWRK